MILAALLAVQPIEAPRPTGVQVESQQSLIDLQTCITRELVRLGRVTPLPLADGAALDFQMRSIGFGGPGKPIATIEIRDRDEKRLLTILYRHPWSAKAAMGFFRSAGKRCFPEEWSSQNPQLPTQSEEVTK